MVVEICYNQEKKTKQLHTKLVKHPGILCIKKAKTKNIRLEQRTPDKNKEGKNKDT